MKAQIKAIRADAKRTMFLTCFSSYRYQPKSKGILKKYYPTLVLLLDNFKKNAVLTYQTIYDTDRQRYDFFPETKQGKKTPKDVGNASLAVLLQNIESNIFIDHIVSYCLQNKIIGATGEHLHYEIRYEGVAVDPVVVQKQLGKERY